MPSYQYKVVPAPTKGVKAKGVKTAEARFSHAIEALMNELAAEGWEYQRAETLPSTERAGLTGSTTEWRNLLVFRRLRENAAEAFQPELLPPPAAPAEPPLTAPEKTVPDAPVASDPMPDKPAPEVLDSLQNDPEAAEGAGNISNTIRRFASTRKATDTTD